MTPDEDSWAVAMGGRGFGGDRLWRGAEETRLVSRRGRFDEGPPYDDDDDDDDRYESEMCRQIGAILGEFMEGQLDCDCRDCRVGDDYDGGGGGWQQRKRSGRRGGDLPPVRPPRDRVAYRMEPRVDRMIRNMRELYEIPR